MTQCMFLAVTTVAVNSLSHAFPSPSPSQVGCLPRLSAIKLSGTHFTLEAKALRDHAMALKGITKLSFDGRWARTRRAMLRASSSTARAPSPTARCSLSPPLPHRLSFLLRFALKVSDAHVFRFMPNLAVLELGHTRSDMVRPSGKSHGSRSGSRSRGHPTSSSGPHLLSPQAALRSKLNLTWLPSGLKQLDLKHMEVRLQDSRIQRAHPERAPFNCTPALFSKRWVCTRTHPRTDRGWPPFCARSDFTLLWIVLNSCKHVSSLGRAGGG